MNSKPSPACNSRLGRFARAEVLVVGVVLAFSLGACREASRGGVGTGPGDGVRADTQQIQSWPASGNVLILTLDTTRSDVLGCYGGDPEATPHLDRLAAKSHLFERCSTSVPQTLPAHTTLFSGLHPGRHGIRKNFSGAVEKRVPLLAEDYRKAGFNTGAFVSAFVLDRRFGLSRGFDVYDPPTFDVRGTVKEERCAAETVDAAIDWIEDQEGPWFAWVHLFDPHSPYKPPEPFAERFPGDPYLGEVASMDSEIGRLIRTLEESGIMDQTGVIVCGDHGEGLGDHGEPSHGILLYESTTRVPLLIHMPAQTEGRRHQQPVALIDLAPTLLDVISQTGSFDGESLLPTLIGKSIGESSRTLYMESLEGYFRSGWSPIYALIEGRWKYILSPRPELYDVVADPSETEDLSDQFPAVADRLRTELAPLIPDEDVASGTAAGLSAGEHEALIALGYVAGTPGSGVGSRKNPADLIHLAAIHQRALGAFKKGRLAEAAELFRRELEEDSESPLLLWYLGSCMASTRPDEASDLFRKAIELRPDFEEPYVSLCALLQKENRTPEVLSVARGGVQETEDTFGRLHFFRALAVLRVDGFCSEVLGDLDVAVNRGRAPVNAYRLRAGIRWRELGDADGALEDLEKCVSLLNSHEKALLYSDRMFATLHGKPRFEKLFTAGR